MIQPFPPEADPHGRCGPVLSHLSRETKQLLKFKLFLHLIHLLAHLFHLLLDLFV